MERSPRQKVISQPSNSAFPLATTTTTPKSHNFCAALSTAIVAIFNEEDMLAIDPMKSGLNLQKESYSIDKPINLIKLLEL